MGGSAFYYLKNKNLKEDALSVIPFQLENNARMTKHEISSFPRVEPPTTEAQARRMETSYFEKPDGKRVSVRRTTWRFCLVMFVTTEAKQRGLHPVLTVEVAGTLVYFTTFVL